MSPPFRYYSLAVAAALLVACAARPAAHDRLPLEPPPAPRVVRFHLTGEPGLERLRELLREIPFREGDSIELLADDLDEAWYQASYLLEVEGWTDCLVYGWRVCRDRLVRTYVKGPFVYTAQTARREGCFRFGALLWEHGIPFHKAGGQAAGYFFVLESQQDDVIALAVERWDELGHHVVLFRGDDVYRPER